MQQLKIRARIYFGFGTVVAIGLAVAGFGVVQSIHVRREVDTMGTLADNVARGLKISGLLATIRGETLTYGAHPDEAVLRQMLAQGSRIRSLLSAAIATEPSPQRRQGYLAVRETAGAARKAFDAFVQSSRDAADARARLFAGGSTVGMVATRLSRLAEAQPGAPDALAAEKLRTAVVLIADASWRFVATVDPRGPAVFAGALAMTDAAFAGLDHVSNPDEKALIAAERDSVAAYSSDFHAFADAKLKSVALYDDEIDPGITMEQARLHAVQIELERDFA